MGRGIGDHPANPNDLTTIHAGPEGQDPTKHKRKQTLLSLLDALAELSKDEDLNGMGTLQQPSFEDDRDVPTVDEHLQKVGAEAFNKFQRRVMNLDKELRNFANAARQLGSSVGILSSSYHLRGRLAQILYLFRENAADLFPRKISHQTRESLTNPQLAQYRKSKRHRVPPHVHNPIVMEKLDPEDFPEQLQMFAQDVTTFLDCLNEFPEFTDEAVNAAVLSLEGDLKYWASSLKQYEKEFRFPAVQRYLHDLSGEMGEHIDNITTSLSVFIEIGVPTIRFAQKHASQNLLNLSTVATFFSAVTATTMQFSFNMTTTPLQNAVNSFWFTSLVFSIGAAVNSLLGVTWKQAMYRSPGHRVPWWVLIWIKRSPLAFLVLSVACFSIGLVLFAYASQQHQITCTLTTVFSACSIIGLTAVSAWFASERWTFSRHNGTKWLADVLSETKVRVKSTRGAQWLIYEPREAFRTASRWVAERFRQVGEGVSELSARTLSRLNLNGDSDDEKYDAERAVTPGTTVECASPEPMSPTFRRAGSDAGPLLPIAEIRSPTATSVDGGDGGDGASIMSDSPGPSTAAPGRGRFANAVRAVIKMRVASSAFPVEGRNPRRQRTMSSDGNGRDAEPVGVLKNSRVGTLMPKLRSLQTTQSFEAHSALVRHLQFSPNGKFLATSSWDRTSVIFKVGEQFTSHRILAHPQGFVGQVAWSPSGNLLLTKLGRGVKVWTEDGVCKKTIDRRRNVQSIAWLPGGEGFLSVEGSDVTKLDLTGTVLATYHFERLIIHDVAVTPDQARMVCVGTLTASMDGLHPSKCRAEKQIIVYNMETEKIENRVPVLHEVRDITLARNDHVALVSYENKAPPQLWKLEPIKKHQQSANTEIRLSLRHTYMPKTQVDFAGPSYFGGKNDQLVLCAGKAGDIHIWDRESGTLLHHIRSQTVGGDLTCIAWNHAWDTFMFATGSHDGAVRIWTSPASSNIPGSEASSIFAASRAPTNPANTPGTTTPNAYDADYRTDSPTGQLTSESLDPATPGTPGILTTGSGSAANAFGALPQARPSVVTFSSQAFGSSER
ncbi:WD40 repeat-like protein [Dichomitus squalens]|uniref:WD40 repeat-like protein n=1 Tax=Dichomitus squalens TaxID=114155 RepID=A0A4Q9NFH9_9APHY|nr:WD40 repeat-like protein [Dichomitus squalens]TBU52053.1 WD40 repeat-like protein [Dichomitus squalens]